MMGGGLGGAGFGMMLLFWAVVVAGALWLLATTFPRPTGNRKTLGRPGDVDWGETPRDIIERRYASGEIGRAEYETMREDLKR